MLNTLVSGFGILLLIRKAGLLAKIYNLLAMPRQRHYGGQVGDVDWKTYSPRHNVIIVLALAVTDGRQA